MKKVSLFTILLGLSIFLSSYSAQAQMMGIQPSTSQTSNNSQTVQDEAAGKAVWDKLQNKQVSCIDLKDDDFDVLGDFFMGNMMGANHSSMNQMMVQRLGENGEKQMHIALGKRLSGCDTNATFPQGAGYFSPMMGLSGGMMNNGNIIPWQGGSRSMMGSTFGVFGLITWITLLTFLILGSLFFWKEINRKR